MMAGTAGSTPPATSRRPRCGSPPRSAAACSSCRSRRATRSRAGEVVARFDTVDAEHELARARAELDAADARLRLLLAGTRARTCGGPRTELARAQAELDAASRDLARLEGSPTAAPPPSRRATTRARGATSRSAAVAASARRARQADRRTAPRRRSRPRARAARPPRRAVAAIEQRIADATVLAPRDGVITERAAEPGEVLPPGALLSVLTDLDQPWLTVYVDEPSLSRVRLGDPVEVRVDGSDRALRGDRVASSRRSPSSRPRTSRPRRSAPSSCSGSRSRSTTRTASSSRGCRPTPTSAVRRTGAGRWPTVPT